MAKSSQRDEAVKLLEQLKAESARRYVPNLSFALVYAALGEKGEAFVWKKISPRSISPTYYAVNALFDDFRDDPRFADLIRRAALAKMD